MKATGIVRRIDDLGRVVIPKELRKTLRIKEGDPLEIFTDKEYLVMQKYSPILSLDANAQSVADSVHELTGKSCVVCDTDKILYISGVKNKDCCGKPISAELENALKERKSLLINRSEGGEIIKSYSDENIDYMQNQIIVPIVSGGDCYGAIMLNDLDKEKKLDATHVKFVQLGAMFLANQF